VAAVVARQSLEALHRPSLVLLVRLFGLGSFWSTLAQPPTVLAATLRHHFEEVLREDAVLRRDGLDTLVAHGVAELEAACAARGLVVAEGTASESELRHELHGWLERSASATSGDETLWLALHEQRRLQLRYLASSVSTTSTPQASSA